MLNLYRAILIDPFDCQITEVVVHDARQLGHQLYRFIRCTPAGVLLACGDTIWHADPTFLTGGQCHFAMPSLLGQRVLAGRAVITGDAADCASTLDQLDAAVLWLAGPDWDGQ